MTVRSLTAECPGPVLVAVDAPVGDITVIAEAGRQVAELATRATTGDPAWCGMSEDFDLRKRMAQAAATGVAAVMAEHGLPTQNVLWRVDFDQPHFTIEVSGHIAAGFEEVTETLTRYATALQVADGVTEYQAWSDTHAEVVTEIDGIRVAVWGVTAYGDTGTDTASGTGEVS